MKNSAIFLVFIFAVILAAFAGYFASSHPDGLEKVATVLKFDHRIKSTPGVFVDYSVSIIKNTSISTIMAGIFGIILLLFIFSSLANIRHIGSFIKRILNLGE